MALGARSLRGAMGTYAWTALVAVLVLAVVLWRGPWAGAPRPTVSLDPDGPWNEGALDDGVRVWALHPGEPLELPPGRYRVTLFAPDGSEQHGELELADEPLQLGRAVAPALSVDPGASR